MKITINHGFVLFMAIIISMVIIALKNPDYFNTFSWGFNYGIISVFALLQFNHNTYIQYKRKWKFWSE